MKRKTILALPAACFWSVIGVCLLGIAIRSFRDFDIAMAVAHPTDLGKSFLDALWYCFAIVTTIGFGDITAATLLGRILSVILGIYGIIVVALITSIIVNFYGEVKKETDAQDPREEVI